jgi:hypothetical protein
MNEPLYINLLKKMLIDYHRTGFEEYTPINYHPNWKFRVLSRMDKVLRTKNFAVCRLVKNNHENRLEGRGWPSHADTMIGLKRL